MYFCYCCSGSKVNDKNIYIDLHHRHFSCFKTKNRWVFQSRIENTEFLYDTEIASNVNSCPLIWISSAFISKGRLVSRGITEDLTGTNFTLLIMNDFHAVASKASEDQVEKRVSAFSRVQRPIVPLGRDVVLFVRRTTINRARRRTCAKALRSARFPCDERWRRLFWWSPGLKRPVFFGAFDASVLRFDHEFHTLVTRRVFHLPKEENVAKLLTFAFRPC